MLLEEGEGEIWQVYYIVDIQKISSVRDPMSDVQGEIG